MPEPWRRPEGSATVAPPFLAGAKQRHGRRRESRRHKGRSAVADRHKFAEDDARMSTRSRISSPVRAALGLGSNLGDPAANVRRAAELLAAGGVEVLALSPLYRSQAVDCEPGAPAFCNAVLIGRWAQSALALLDLCHEVERHLGRPTAHSSHQSRPIDVDILLFGNATICTPSLTIPHPRLRQRLFALVPLCDVAPRWPIPRSRRSVAFHCARLLRRTSSPEAALQPWPEG